ncbi:MAG: DUF4465 domain-containing protein [Gemmataceae bacterium]|nr:DUF4465 domain-containing protein [Gemmataceae bacterium]
MKKIALLALLGLASICPAQVIGLEDVAILPGQFVNNQTVLSGGATFHNFVDPMFGSWAGFAASRVTDVTTVGFTNQYSAFSASGGGDGSAQYAVGYFDTFNDVRPTVTLPAGTRPTSVRVANTTYAYFSMLLGDSYSKKFGGVSGNDPDYFQLIVTGRDAGNAVTGTTSIYLADYRFANNAQDYLLGGWTTLDLAGLGSPTTMQFDFASSDVGPFGINTPTYFALDNLTVSAVPEPTALLLLGPVASCWLIRRRGR